MPLLVVGDMNTSAQGRSQDVRSGHEFLKKFISFI